MSEQAQQRIEANAAAAAAALAAQGGEPGARETFFSGADVVQQMGRMQLKEAQRELREHQNKLQLREVLARQAAEKRLRELQEHQSTYGDLPRRHRDARQADQPREHECDRRRAACARGQGEAGGARGGDREEAEGTA